MDGGDNTYHPRCLDCGCTAPFDAWQSRTPAKPSREDWIKASDRMPETGKKVFAFYLNEIGKPRKIMAFYTPRFTMEQDEDPNEATEYCEDKDAYYLKEGWYEDNEFDECHWKVDGKITHWMPLPESPKEDR